MSKRIDKNLEKVNDQASRGRSRGRGRGGSTAGSQPRVSESDILISATSSSKRQRLDENPQRIQNQNNEVTEITDPTELRHAEADVEVRRFGIGDKNAGFDFDGERANLQASMAAQGMLVMKDESSPEQKVILPLVKQQADGVDDTHEQLQILLQSPERLDVEVLAQIQNEEPVIPKEEESKSQMDIPGFAQQAARRRRALAINYDENRSDGTSALNVSNQLQNIQSPSSAQQAANKDQDYDVAMVSYWLSLQQKGLGSEMDKEFCKKMSEFTMAQLKTAPADKCLDSRLFFNQQVLPNNYDAWLRSERKPDCWLQITGVQHVEQSLSLVIANPSWSQALRGTYAAHIVKCVTVEGYDYQSLKYQPELIENDQVTDLVQQCVQASYTKNKKQNNTVFKLSAYLPVTLFKLGQIQNVFATAYDQLSCKWGDIAATTDFRQPPTKSKKKVAKNEYRLGHNLILVFPQLNSQCISLMFKDANHVKLAHLKFLTELNKVAQYKQMAFVQIIINGTTDFEQDPFEHLQRMIKIDASYPWLADLVRTAFLKKRQHFGLEELLTYMLKLGQYGQSQTRRFLENPTHLNDLSKALQIFDASNQQSSNVNRDAVQTYVQSKLDEDQTGDKRKVFDTIKNLIRNNVTPADQQIPKGQYEVDDYQVLIAADISKMSAVAIVKIPAAQGKTNIILNSALHSKFVQGHSRICIVTSTEVLANQLKRHLQGVAPYLDFEVCHVGDPASIQEADCYYIDEADETLRSLVTWDTLDFTLNGLFHMTKATKLVFLSATLNQYLQRVVIQVFCKNGYAQFPQTTVPFEYKSQYQITTNAVKPYEIKFFNYQKSDQMVIDLMKDLEDKQMTPRNRPLIFMMENWDNKLIKLISDKLRELFGFDLIVMATENDLVEKAPALFDAQEGAMILKTTFGRGVNVKFGVPAEVIVISNGGKLSIDDVTQMVGRSDRRQGLQRGRVYVVTGVSTSSRTQGAEAYLIQKATPQVQDDGGNIASILFKKMPAIVSKEFRRKVYEQIGEPPGWRTNKQKFRGHQQVFRLFNEGAYLGLE